MATILTDKQLDNLFSHIENMKRLEKLTKRELISEVLSHDIADNQLVTELLNRLEPNWQDKPVGYYSEEITQEVETSGETYLIWSNEKNSWWKPNSRGYTEKIEEAGRYSLTEALEIEKDANGYLARGQEPKDVKLKENDVLASRNR